VSNIIPVKRINQSTNPCTQLCNSSTEICTVGIRLLWRHFRSPSIAQCRLCHASCAAARLFVLLTQIQHIGMQYEMRRESFNEDHERYKINKFFNMTQTWRHERWIMKFMHNFNKLGNVRTACQFWCVSSILYSISLKQWNSIRVALDKKGPGVALALCWSFPDCSL
jgi:hypothetical protein